MEVTVEQCPSDEWESMVIILPKWESIMLDITANFPVRFLL